eukprot:CAMPEP_0205859042 /NCGR_PEP_ID=MMETSP1083-20121108/4519_1 /ASSEMBLY_ACC=CAM_ASM_000430 /TAXON_ID=97485 /ORGANISM="Prymnesium parvum, Strain Texoma1" /LENGTH=50 /DNA_ID=CAMNT_0053220641 /DNA_START=299 /DNA_END=448 /DNA_ORIENTATION=+
MDRSHDVRRRACAARPTRLQGWQTLLRDRAPTDAPDGCVDHGELAPCEEP